LYGNFQQPDGGTSRYLATHARVKGCGVEQVGQRTREHSNSNLIVKALYFYYDHSSSKSVKPSGTHFITSFITTGPKGAYSCFRSIA
jgi:hypothetical protein